MNQKLNNARQQLGRWEYEQPLIYNGILWAVFAGHDGKKENIFLLDDAFAHSSGGNRSFGEEKRKCPKRLKDPDSALSQELHSPSTVVKSCLKIYVALCFLCCSSNEYGFKWLSIWMAFYQEPEQCALIWHRKGWSVVLIPGDIFLWSIHFLLYCFHRLGCSKSIAFVW